MSSLARHFVLIHVAALVVYTSWAFAGTRVAWLWPIAWLTLGVIEAMIVAPPAAEGESCADARRRMARGVARDPLFAVGALLTLFLAFQGFNGPRTLSYLDAQAAWRFGDPPLRGLPSGVAILESVQLLAWFPPAIIAALAVRHALDAAGRRLMLRVLVWNAAGLSLLGCLHVAGGWKQMYGVIPIGTQFFASFGYPNHAGAFFTFTLVLGLGCWLHERESLRPYADAMLAALGLIFAATVLCLSRTSILMGLAVALVGGAFAFVRVWPTLKPGGRIVVPFVSAFLALLGALAMFGNYPGNPVRRELGTLTVSVLFRQVWERAFEMLVPAAIAIWRDNPWYGVGGWGFRHFVPLYLTPDQHRKLFVGAANVHNDFFNFLAEHGAVGTGLLLLAGLILLVPLLRRLPSARARRAALACGASLGLLRGFVLVALLLLLCHSAIDLPFRCPAVIQTVLIALAAAGGLCGDVRRAAAEPIDIRRVPAKSSSADD